MYIIAQLFDDVKLVSKILSGSEQVAERILARRGEIIKLPGVGMYTLSEMARYYGVTPDKVRYALSRTRCNSVKEPVNVKRLEVLPVLQAVPGVYVQEKGTYTSKVCFDHKGSLAVFDIPNKTAMLYTARAVVAASVCLGVSTTCGSPIATAVLKDVLVTPEYLKDSSSTPMLQKEIPAESSDATTITVTPEMLDRIVRAAVSAAVDAVFAKVRPTVSPV